nr:uncharacterized protein LOC127302392 isoform X2 [Lolium perenne]
MPPPLSTNPQSGGGAGARGVTSPVARASLAPAPAPPHPAAGRAAGILKMRSSRVAGQIAGPRNGCTGSFIPEWEPDEHLLIQVEIGAIILRRSCTSTCKNTTCSCVGSPHKHQYQLIRSTMKNPCRFSAGNILNMSQSCWNKGEKATRNFPPLQTTYT